MARHIHIHVGTKDAGNWEENKHPRAENGQFGKGSGGGAKPAAKKAPAAKKDVPAIAVKTSNRGPGALAQMQAQSNAHLKATGFGHLVTPAKNKPGTGTPSPSGRSMTPKEVVAQTNANAGKLSVNMDKIKEGSALYDKSGKKVDEVESIEKRRLGNGWTLNTRAGYQVHVGEGGHNAQGWGTEPPTSSGKINTNTEAGRSLASGLLKQATAKPSAPAPKAAPVDYAAGAKRAHQESLKATGQAKQDWTQASKYYSMARSEASSENPDKGTIREAEAKARYHEARAQGKPIEMPDY